MNELGIRSLKKNYPASKFLFFLINKSKKAPTFENQKLIELFNKQQNLYPF